MTAAITELMANLGTLIDNSMPLFELFFGSILVIMFVGAIVKAFRGMANRIYRG